MAVIDVDLAGRAYKVQVGGGLLANMAQEAAPFLESYGSRRPVPIVADANARRHWGGTVEDALSSAGHRTDWYDVPAGEASKSWARLEDLTDWLLALGITRSDHVFALGGGVVGDLVGFACAILKRGCGFVQLPTTLLAQVDSSVGGKTAINTATGKNLVGAFHQPSLVLADTDTLATLPERELRSGYAEVLKYGVLGNIEFFDWLSENRAAVLSLEQDALIHAVAHSVAAKARIVAADERETQDLRALLNLGHTFGHALEAQTGFSDRLLHGESVALGMVLAARYSARRGDLSLEDAERVDEQVALAGLPASLAALDLDCDGSALVDHMRHDKKMEGSTLPFILLRDIGDAYLARDVALDDVAAFLDEQLRSH
ncbi:3-dehydroquinate synthase [Qipengyuania sp. JC766]|uniref:3-dehydroquinate synthase n=1 Tax=Qipengyuania sp. JC766 TaxID=3232139 RepID=UPI00345824E3